MSLRFEMSLVGPRPLPVDEVKRFDERFASPALERQAGADLHSGRCRAQRRQGFFNTWVRMDLEYIDNWSLWLDIKILWRTIWVVLLGKGSALTQFHYGQKKATKKAQPRSVVTGGAGFSGVPPGGLSAGARTPGGGD
jgi:hypothetical protein